MQVFTLAISRVLLPALSFATTETASTCRSQGNGWKTQAFYRTTPLTQPVASTSTDQMALTLEHSVLTSPWEAASPGTSTCSSPTRELRSTAALRGLDSCATAQSNNPLTFAMQVFTLAISRVLLPALSFATTETASTCRSQGNGWKTQAFYRTTPLTQPVASTSTDQMALTLEHSVLTSPWEAASPGTSTCSSPTRELRSTAALRGLDSCATAQSNNPLTFAMQVSKPYALFSKKSSNYFLLQLPSPRCCFLIVVECTDVIRSLLMQSGDVESNPGPNTTAILDELHKISAGQSKLISEVSNLKDQLLTTNQTIAQLSQRMNDVEKHCQSLTLLRTEIDNIKSNTAQTARQVFELEARLDDAENRSRRNNLVFYGLPEPSNSESYAQTEELVIQHCREHLGLTINPKEIERVHRLGRHPIERGRPIIVKFSFYKMKEAVLSNARKLKGTNYSIAQDFSRSVRNARKHLVAFAKTKSARFQLSYKTLSIGSKKYIYDEVSQTVKEFK
ncbi:uncharacterized protein LOC119384134 [Rhipicephalus sanguineus]|nr:uncharacterized protein LOC119384134 [Rhipicephalus sanguineus]